MKKQVFIHLILIFLLFTFGETCTASSSDDEEALIIKEISAHRDAYDLQAAFTRLHAALHPYPDSAFLHRLRGDLHMMRREDADALAAYQQARRLDPGSLQALWSEWSLLNRMSREPEEQIQLLEQIAAVDSRNPLIHLRLGRELHEVDRFEDSLVHFRKAVELEPAALAYRLYLVRALFDVLRYQEAQQELEFVMNHAREGTAIMAGASNLGSLLRGESMDKGARSEFFGHTKNAPGQRLKDHKAWALEREKGWQLMREAQYEEAEQTWRRVLELDPDDHRARYELGLALLKLDRNAEAVAALEESLRVSKYPEFYPNALFHMGRGLAELGQWDAAIEKYERILAIQDWQENDFYALNFPDVKHVRTALEEARRAVGVSSSVSAPHASPTPDSYRTQPPPSSQSATDIPPHDVLEQIVPLNLNVVRGWFRQLIPARAVVRDDLQAGFHDFIPLDPADTFVPDQEEIYVIFFVTASPQDSMKLTSRWVAEIVQGYAPDTVVGTDTVMLELNGQSGYWYLSKPETGWGIGTYRVDLFVGDEVSAKTLVADVRFRIVEPQEHPLANH